MGEWSAVKSAAHRFRLPWRCAIVLTVIVVSTIAMAVFAGRTYRSFVFLRSAFETGAPMTASIRPWMTLDYVANSYRIPTGVLVGRLALTPDVDPGKTLKSLAEQIGQSPSELTVRVQKSIADLTGDARASLDHGSSGWLKTVVEQFLTALMQYGYPVLGLTLLFGSFGFPLPDGIVTAVAGSLVAQDRLHWFWASAIAVVASVLGDAAAYGLGLWLDRQVLERHGHWLGYTRHRHASVERLFDRWGAATIFLTRTFISHLSSATSLLAGMGHYPLSKFLVLALVGRMIWTAAYLGIGYRIGADWEATMSFFSNLSGFIAALIILVASSRMLFLDRGAEK